MIDCGLPFKMIKKELYNIKYLLITHVHSDHLKIKTLMKIVERFPHIKLIGNFEVHQAFKMNVIANAGIDIAFDDYTFSPFLCLHDVLTYGYCWTNSEGEEIIYATDTASLEHAPVKKYDYFFLESNHDQKKLEEVRNSFKGGYNPYLSGKRHLSTQQAKNFFYSNRKSIDSELIELHKSKKFY